MSTKNCTPEVPDVQSAVDKAIETARGKVADLDFRPVDFSMDVSKFFSFDMFGRLLGKPDGLGYDMCEICGDSGSGIDGAIGNSPFPDGAQDWADGINQSLQDQQQQIDQNAQNINNIEIPELPGSFSLDSAINILYQQIDSVSDAVDSAGI